MLERVVGGPPKPAGVPFLWRWHDVYAKLLKSCDVMPESLTARRNLSFINPDARGTTHTINMGMQMLKPGEIAYAHRHTMAALRFAIQGGPRPGDCGGWRALSNGHLRPGSDPPSLDVA